MTTTTTTTHRMADPNYVLKMSIPSYKCCIRNCKSHSEPHPEGRISFHAFPRTGQQIVIQTEPGKLGKIDRRIFWCRRLRLREPVSGTLRVCSLHFREQDFYYKRVDETSGFRRFLKRNAVPCRQLPPESANSDEEVKEEVRLQECSDSDSSSLSSEETDNYQSGSSVSEEEQFELVEIKREPVVPDEAICTEHTTETTEVEVTIKEELLEEEGAPTIKAEPPDIGEIKLETETFSCKQCGGIVPQENSFCDGCHQSKVVTKTEPCVLEILLQRPTILEYSGLKTPEAFIELLKYLEDDLAELEDCHKSNQLLSVLIKLHSNRDSFYVNKYRFPLVYVKTVDTLSERLTFLGEAAWRNDTTPAVLQPLIGETGRKLVIFHVISLQVYLSGIIAHNKDHKTIFVAYTASGRPFYISPLYPRSKTLQSMVPSSMVFSALNAKKVFVIYKLDHEFVKATPEDFGRIWERLVDERVHDYLEELTMKLEANFHILRDVFPDYACRDSNGAPFLWNIVSACMGLLNYKLYLKQ